MNKILPILSLLFLAIGHLKGQNLEHRIYLIGDAGELVEGEHPVVDQVKKMMLQEPEKNPVSVLFLGDNIYPKGMPEVGAKRFDESILILEKQAALADLVPENVWIIPGNHDWEKGGKNGLQAVLSAQAYIDSMNRENLHWIPRDGCPGPSIIHLSKNAVIIFIDSQWWLQADYQKPTIDSDCEFKSDEELLAAVEDLVLSHKDKVVMLAMHHPLKTYGEHNGAFSWKDHLFPLTAIQPDLYLPLPLIGSIYPLYRTYLGNIQDLAHPRYRELTKSISEILKSHPRAMVLSGHEHALEYTIDKNHTHHIVSGAGAKGSLIKKNNEASFTYGKQGFATIDVYSNGEISLSFFSLEKGIDPIFQQTVFSEESSHNTREDRESILFEDSVTVAVSEQYDASPGQEKWYGTNYRQEWGQAVKFRTLDIRKEKGGLTVLKRGGGMQTRSLRLADPSGKEYVLRSVEKYPESAIPKVLRKTVANDIVQDQISASHPYGALIIPPLAGAAKVYHTDPELVWLPDDPALGIFQEDFGGAIYLFEEREIRPDNLDDEDYKFYSTDKMLRKRLEDQDYELDQKKVLRARLLDLFIGDWDRHDDQWRWIGVETKKGREFLPMPRDRDQAFFVNEGILPKIASRKWIMPKFQGFDHELRDVNGFMFNGRYFDRSFLNDLDREDWEEEVDDFIERMDDKAIDKALERLPKAINQYRGREVADKLKHRKSWLKEEALTYYDFISKNVDVYGTFKDELFEIRHEPDGKVDVEVSKISKKGNAKQKIFNRKFDPEVTQEIRLYGLEGEDEFTITGEGPGKIKVRLMSGLEPDQINDQSELKRKANLIYQWQQQPDKLVLGRSSRILSSKSSSVFDYDRKAFKYDKLMPLVSLEYNVDDGIFLGGGVLWTKQGFRKSPYALKQSIKANIAVKTGSKNLYYQGHAVDILGALDLEWDAAIKAPDYVNNFFGYGNERSEFMKDEFGARYYRVRYNQINLNTWLRKDFGDKIALKFGPLLQRTKMDEDDNIGKYIGSEDQADIDIDQLNRSKFYTGANVQLLIDNTDHPNLPNRGVRFLQDLSYYGGINENSKDLGTMVSELSLYWSRQIPSLVTWATKFGGGLNWGQYEFFQAQALGGQNNLRGSRRSRYLGDAVVYNNTEARIRLDNLTTRLFPASLGMIVFHDIGRVCFEDENSSKWHNSYGAGVWLAPMNLLVLSATVAIGEEEVLPTFTFGFQF